MPNLATTVRFEYPEMHVKTVSLWIVAPGLLMVCHDSVAQIS